MIASSRRLGDRAALVAATGALATYVVARRLAIPDAAHLATNLAATGAIAALAVASRLTVAELGCARHELRAGLRLGGLALAVVAVVVAVGLAVPASRGWFDTERTEVASLTMVRIALVEIPFGTVVFEEFAFRAVLLALALRVLTRRVAVAVTVAAFSLWHLPPLIGDATDAAGATVVGSGAGVVAATLAATAVAGLVLTWLRLRSGSLAAPVLAHLGTNSVTFTLAWAVT